MMENPKSRLWWTEKTLEQNRLDGQPWLQLMCYAPVSGHEVGHVF